ncbi:MAG: hypothetical protein KBB21_28855 [Nannocystaceae bacterium]|nr:hypothetical protein [Deltaproteobacteria bacterium]MBP7290669.1 hypothetical protein [Nannocystaceae bacterium]
MAKNRALVELLTRAGPAYSRVPARLREVPITAARERVLEVESLLHLRDGFRTLDGALYVRPSVTVAQVRGNDDWNALTLWRGTWRHATTLYFFAEDVLGRQFALHRHGIVRLEPATGAVDPWADDLEGWAARVLAEPDALGHAAVTQWEAEHERLRAHERLQAHDPTMLEVPEATTWRAREDVELMRRWALVFRVHLAHPDTALDPSMIDEAAWWGPE